MQRISILKKDTIFLGHSILPHIIEESLSIKASTYIIITDSNLESLSHWQNLTQAFKSQLPNQARLITFIVPPGESVKTRNCKALVEDWLLDEKCTRDSCLIAFGGGVIGDMAGFIASTFMRGIPIIQIPTTLLAMVDSSIGGKTAVDTRHGKNLIGSFHQPARVLIDTVYLSTLPVREFCNGMAEVVKAAAVSDVHEFDYLERNSAAIMAFASGNVTKESSDIMIRLIKAAVSFKANVVTLDEKEGGLRAVLNFGHSVGHAIETILTPTVLHGECVAVGMVFEAEISRNLGHCSSNTVGRLSRCMKSFNLPITLDGLLSAHAPHKICPLEALLDVMSIDKKNQGGKKKIVLLSGIGKTAERGASVVQDVLIRKILAPALRITPPTFPLGGSRNIRVPGSKSISNRALLLAALGKGKCKLVGLLHSDDVAVMLTALQSLVGITYEWLDDESLLVEGGAGRLAPPSHEIYLGNAGTASRFLTSVCALANFPSKSTILTGNSRMKQRPIGPLVDALVENGCGIKYIEQGGSLPIEIKANGIKGGEIKLDAKISSQYVSSILLSAPYASTPVTLILVGDAVISKPYIEMTLQMMKAFGINVVKAENYTYHIPLGTYTNPTEYCIEADASSATYPLAFAAATSSTITVTNIGKESMQGDAAFAVKVLREMGCTVDQDNHSTTVTGPRELQPLGKIDMESMTDAFLTASVLAAIAPGSTEITGIANQRVKECDRIEAMVGQLGAFGVHAVGGDDGLVIHGMHSESLQPLAGSVFCFDDHRVAMSFSILACGVKTATVVNEKRCVEKTWPGWWDALEGLGVQMEGVEVENHQEIESKHSGENIILVGMRGVGKSRAGKCIAAALGLKFVDLDEYLEQELGHSIPLIIEQYGWEYFRKREVEILTRVLAEYKINTVISTGGGLVESSDAQSILAKLISSKSAYVIHLKQGNFQQIVDYLSVDKTRPSFCQDLHSVWQYRQSLYEKCSSSEFIIVRNESESWECVNADLINHVKFLISTEPVKISPNSFFVSLTYGDLEKVDSSVFQSIFEGVDAVELRVDLLDQTDLHFVGCQVFRLKRILGGRLPIIFTVRSVGQSGRFPDEKVDEMFELLSHALDWGCEIIDVEMVDSKGFTRLSLVNSLLSKKSNSLFIGSFHDTTASISWNDELSIVSGRIQQSCIKSIYEALHPFSDIIKLIGKANSIRDNFKLHQFKTEILPALGLSPRPLIAVNMGALGQMSRALNSFMTPVTHKKLPLPAAPGQLTILEINTWRSISGLISPKKMYLFGSPITHSLSPALHNAGFEALGLPFSYSLVEETEANKVKDFILLELANGSFGGASITIPLKETLLSVDLLDLVTPSAKDIGAVNTVMVKDDKLIGDNTDWLGITACISRYYFSGSGAVGIVIGGGGTARAACYALGSLGCKVVHIWNRTLSKADGLADFFSRVWPNTRYVAVEKLAALNCGDVNFLVSTIPADAQDSLDFGFVERFKGCSGVFIELAYKPRNTKMMEKFGEIHGWHVIEGLQVLIEQGYEQFDRWTGFAAPRFSMRAAVLQ